MEQMDATVQEMVQKRHRRRRAFVAGLVATCVLAGGAVAGVIVSTNASDLGAAPETVPSGTSGDKDGIRVAKGEVKVDVYFDYLCPECRRIEKEIAPELKSLQDDGKVTLVYHPVTFLDDYSEPSGYSTRAAEAAACAADAGAFDAYTAALLERQPAEHGPGLSDAELVDLGRSVGVSDEGFADCVSSGRFSQWVKYVSDAAADDNVSMTPTVEVDGHSVDMTVANPADAVVDAVAKADR